MTATAIDTITACEEPGLSAAVMATLVEHHGRFLAFLERRLGSRALAEEILQEAFVRGIDRGSSLRDGESAVAWFYRVLRNAIIDHHRRAGAEQRALAAVAAEAEAAPDAADEAMREAVCA